MFSNTPFASALALAMYGAGALDQGPMLEEVIVTAQKRTENLQDVPISIAAVSGEKVEELAIVDLEELTNYVPNVTINNGAGAPNLFIRGVGSGTNAGFEQSVGMFTDGVYAPDWSATLTARYVMPLGGSLILVNNLDMIYEDSFYSSLSLDPNTKHDSTTIFNARIALANVGRTWSVALAGKNLTDEKSYIYQGDIPLTNSNTYIALPDRPRSIAIQARYNF